MALAAYGLYDNGGTGAVMDGPWKHSVTQVSDISTLVTGTSYYVLGFITGGQRAKFFYSSNGAGPAGATALPTLTVPNSLPNSAVPLNTNAYVYGVGYTGYVPPWGSAVSSQGGLLYFAVTFAAGNPDGGSPGQFSMDLYGLLLIDSASEEWL